MRFLLAAALACTLGVGTSSADEVPFDRGCYFVYIPENVPSSTTTTPCPPPEIGEALGPIENPEFSEVPEVVPEVREDPAPGIASPARPTTSRTIAYTG